MAGLRLRRPRITATRFKRDFLDGNDRADMWRVFDQEARRATSLTVRRHAGYWAPSWSPDGQRLAMLSTRGDNVRLWTWERASGRVGLVSPRGIDTPLVGSAILWISNREVVLPVLPEGAISDSHDAGVPGRRSGHGGLD